MNTKIFLENYWAQKPFIIEIHNYSVEDFSSLLLNEMNRIVLLLNTKDRKSCFGQYSYIWYDGKVDKNISNLFRNRVVDSWQDFISNLKNSLGCKEFFLVINDFHLISTSAYLYSKMLVSPWSGESYKNLKKKEEGLEKGMDISLILGHYKKTPGGLHFDPNHNFFFPIYSVKTIYGLLLDKSEKQDTVTFSNSKNKLNIFKTNPGSCLYWPPHFKHMAYEENVTSTVAVGVGVYDSK